MGNGINDNKLLIKLAVVMSENPGANITDIASKAEISKATFYRLFGTRDNLEKILIEKANDALNNFIKACEYPYDDYRLGLRELIKIHNDGNELMGFIFSIQSSMDAEYWQKYYKAIDMFFLNGQKSGVFRLELSNQLMAELFISCAVGILEAQYRGRIVSNRSDELFEDFFLKGIVI